MKIDQKKIWKFLKRGLEGENTTREGAVQSDERLGNIRLVLLLLTPCLVVLRIKNMIENICNVSRRYKINEDLESQ